MRLTMRSSEQKRCQANCSFVPYVHKIVHHPPVRRRYRPVRTTLLILLIGAGFLSCSAFSADESPIVSKDISTDNSPAAVAAAKARGAASAAKDIKAGTLRILYYGKPWGGKTLIDDATGYRVEIVAGCEVSEPFITEVEAYNSTVRTFHAKRPTNATPK